MRPIKGKEGSVSGKIVVKEWRTCTLRYAQIWNKSGLLSRTPSITNASTPVSAECSRKIVKDCLECFS